MSKTGDDRFTHQGSICIFWSESSISLLLYPQMNSDTEA